jgi:hypothetical protein
VRKSAQVNNILQGDTACAAVLYAASVGAHGTLAELLHRGTDPNS